MHTEDKKPAAPTPAPAPEPVTEPEKIGPMGAVASGVSDLRAVVIASFREAVAAATAATKHPAIDVAVHDCRKALRRARAAVRLVADALGRDDRKELERTIRDARRLLSPARDLAVVPDALASLTIDDETRALAARIIDGRKQTAPSADETRKLVEDAAARLSPLGDVIAAALPVTLGWDDVADGVADTYRIARKGMRRARRSRRAFHCARKRTKELTAQLEMLAGGVDGKTDVVRKAYDELGAAMGAAVDVIMLRDFIEEHAGDAAPEVVSKVLAAIDGELDGQIATGRKAAKALFERPGRRFARKVGKAVRKDHAPPEPPADPN